jgi:DNA replicative helicase MCM subunit Mcm2 (Cdc46/Mcm family)
MPRCIDVICRNEIVEQAKAGDKIVFTGSIAVIPDTSGLSRVGTYIYYVSVRIYVYMYIYYSCINLSVHIRMCV